MIPEGNKDELLHSGISFLRSITTAYGSEKGLELWNQIAEVIDPALKGEIFFAILNGTREDRITIRGILHNDYRKINAIKEVRTWTGMGLIEAKSTVETAEAGKTIIINGPSAKRIETIQVLRECGMLVS